MIIIEWWLWAILGVALMVAELLIPAFVLVWFGLGALIVALAVFILRSLGFEAEVLIWIMSSVAFVLLWFKVFRHARHKTFSGRSSAEAIGEVGLMVNPIERFQKGQVRFQTPLFGADVWECFADEPISQGERVKVVSVDGSILKVTKTGEHT